MIEEESPQITVDMIQKSTDVQEKVRRYYLDRYGPRYHGLEEEDGEKLVEDFFTHLSWGMSNTVAASTLLGFTHNANDEQRQNLADLHTIFTRGMPKFYEEGGRGWLEGLWDHTRAAVIDPSTFFSVASGMSVKVAATAATRAAIKLALQKGLKKGISKDVLRKQIRRGTLTSAAGRTSAAPSMVAGAKRGFITDASIAVIHDSVVQGYERDLSVREGYDPLRGLIAFTLGGSIGMTGGALAAGSKRLGFSSVQREIKKGDAESKFSKPLSDTDIVKLETKEAKAIRKQLRDEMKAFFVDVAASGNEILLKVGRRWGFRPKGERYVKPGSRSEKIQQQTRFNKDELKEFEEGSEFLETRLSEDVLDRVTLALQDFIGIAGEPWDKKKFPKISQQVYHWVKTGKIRGERFQDVLNELEINQNMFADIIYATGSRAGRDLQEISGWRRILDDLDATTPGFGGVLKRNAFDEEMYRLEQLSKSTGLPSNAWDAIFNNKTIAGFNRNRLLSLVSQLGTAVRNGVSVAGARTIPDVAVQGLNNVVNKMTGKRQIKWSDMFSTLYYLSSPGKNIRAKTLAYEMLKDAPLTSRRLFSEWTEATNVMKHQEGPYGRFLHWLNGFNRGQEHFYRAAFFMSDIERQLNGKGINLLDVIANGKLLDVDVISDDMIQKAVRKALKGTFAERPDWDTPVGAFANQAINFVKRSPLGIPMPFPRFLVSAMNYTIDFSPIGLIKNSPLPHYAGKAVGKVTGKESFGTFGKKAAKEWSKGDYTGALEGLVGTSMYGAAWILANSPMMGEKPYEIKLSDVGTSEYITGERKLDPGAIGGLDSIPREKMWDTRAFFPLPVYLTFVDLMKQYYTGIKRTPKQNLKNVLDVVVGSQARVGPLSLGLENALESFFKENDETQGRTFVQIMATIAPQYLVPYQMVNDVLMQTGMQDNKVRSRTGTGMAAGPSAQQYSPFADAIASKMPNFIGDAIHSFLYDEEIKYSIDPTLPPGERLERYAPILKQLLGTTITEKHITKQILDYWGINWKDYSPYIANDRDLTRLAQINMQYLINTVLAPELLMEGTPFSKNVRDFYERRKAGDTNFTNAIIVDGLKDTLIDLKAIAIAQAKMDAPDLALAADSIIKSNWPKGQAAAQRRVVEEVAEDTESAKEDIREEIYEVAARDQFVDPMLLLKREEGGGGLMDIERPGEEVDEETRLKWEEKYGNK